MDQGGWHGLECKKPDSVESGLAVVVSGFFLSRGALFQRKTSVAKPTRASVRVLPSSY